MAATGWQHRPVPIEKHFSIMLQRANTLLNLLIETDKCKLSLSEYLLVKNIPIVILYTYYYSRTAATSSHFKAMQCRASV